MSPGLVSRRVVTERSEWVREMLGRIRDLPLDSYQAFTSDPRNVDAAESCLRRALEALLDIGRHILAKGFGDAPAEYRQVATQLGERGVLNAEESDVFARMARYRNRLVHFYDRVSEPELGGVSLSAIASPPRYADSEPPAITLVAHKANC